MVVTAVWIRHQHSDKTPSSFQKSSTKHSIGTQGSQFSPLKEPPSYSRHYRIHTQTYKPSTTNAAIPRNKPYSSRQNCPHIPKTKATPSNLQSELAALTMRVTGNFTQRSGTLRYMLYNLETNLEYTNISLIHYPGSARPYLESK